MNSQHSPSTSPTPDVHRTFGMTIHAMFTQARLWQIFGLGVASGFGFLIHRTPVTLWLISEGRSRTSIGLFAAVLLPYAFNFVWAPLVDHLRIPFVSRLGQLRSWLFLSLVVMFGCTLGASFLELPTHVTIKAPSIESSPTVNITEVRVQTGEYVEQGSVLFVVRAGSSTESVSSPTSGRVINVSNVSGDVVKPDDPIVILREEANNASVEPESDDQSAKRPNWLPEFSPLFILALLMVTLAFASATLDIATAGYRITIIQENEGHLVGLAASMEIAGWWAGFTLPAVAIVGTDFLGWSWPTVFKWLAVFFVLLILFLLFCTKEPQRPSHAASRERGIDRIFDELIVKRLLGPVIEFFKRNGVALALCLLFFLVSFKLGEAFLGNMSTNFYKEVGFANTELWLFSKLGNFAVIVPTTILAGMFVGRFKITPTLVVAGIAMASTNLMLSWMAIVGDSLVLYFFTILFDGITAAFSTVAFVTFITMYTARLHATTQYAAMASIANSGRTVIAMLSGLVVDLLGGNWTLFFILTALWIIPVMGILHVLTRLVKLREGEGVQVKTYHE
ncbi:MAG: MFS transporter [Gammaproteobacteria bacterium]|nr:MFS transporter [Gammaproteobacteria bacterium]